MQTYDPARRSPYQSAIPAMRHAPERSGSHSATPIYDALYAEYRMTFRTLPGDRSGEEELRFKSFAALAGFTDCTGFATGLHGMERLQTGGHLQAAGLLPEGVHHTGGPHQAAGFPGPRHEPRQLPGGPSQTGPAAHTAYGAYPGGLTSGPPHTAHHPHPADRPGGHQVGIWRPVRKQHGPEALLPAVLPTRPPGEGTDR